MTHIMRAPVYLHATSLMMWSDATVTIANNRLIFQVMYKWTLLSQGYENCFQKQQHKWSKL